MKRALRESSRGMLENFRRWRHFHLWNRRKTLCRRRQGRLKERKERGEAICGTLYFSKRGALEWAGQPVCLRNRADGFDVEDVAILVQRPADATLFSNKALDFSSVRQSVRSAVHRLFQKKSTIFLSDLSREGADVLLVLLLGCALQFVAVLILLRTLLLLLALSFLRVAGSSQT